MLYHVVARLKGLRPIWVTKDAIDAGTAREIANNVLKGGVLVEERDNVILYPLHLLESVTIQASVTTSKKKRDDDD